MPKKKLLHKTYLCSTERGGRSEKPHLFMFKVYKGERGKGERRVE